MFFEKSKSKRLDMNLFKNPTAEYRGAPFWSWNTKLDKESLLMHIEAFEKMGLGGFNMHARVGLATEYLGKEFMEMVKFCTEKAKEKGLYAWLYDEDKWPSGFAGGKVTKEAKYRQRYLVFTVNKSESTKDSKLAAETGKPFLLACYDVKIDADSFLESYKLIDENEEAKGDKWYVYVMTHSNITWFNGEAYIDTLDAEAVDKFIEYTHEEYKKVVGDEFGKTVPYIFTDEPRVSWEYKRCLFSNAKDDAYFLWGKGFEEDYKKVYGEDIIAELPELMWEKKEGISPVRHKYFSLIATLFEERFMKRYGDWCRANNIGFTGHLMAEDDLTSQTYLFAGETMPSYKYFDVPGIDMLCAEKNFNTAKQCQSVTRQLGKEGMLSELYGVTDWDFDFRGHKLEGDWQAAMGVTHRVHHLTFLTMEGAAKRDYPASIGYQSPWYDQYAYVEDHFARLATVLTRGKPIVKVGVIHPVESFWISVGPVDKTGNAQKSMEHEFAQLNQWLALGNIDFDLISEKMLPELCDKGSNPLKVGEMEYDAIIVPNLKTIRKSTVERLSAFANEGGNLIFVGNAPEYVDLEKSDAAKDLCEKSKKVSFNKLEIASALADNTDIEILNGKGKPTDNLAYQMRQDGEDRWLFIAHAKVPACVDTVKPEKLRIKVKGEFDAELYDTVDGEIKPLTFTAENGYTVIEKEVYSHDSLLIKLSNAKKGASVVEQAEFSAVKTVDFKKALNYSLSEPNALLLDRAEYSLDGGEYHEEDEVLRLCEKVKKSLGWKTGGSDILQPWIFGEEKIEHSLSLKYTFDSEIDYSGALLAVEKPEDITLTFNGKAVDMSPTGFFVDKSIKTVKIPEIKKGENVIEMSMPFGQLTFPEWIYILGDFGVRVQGASATIVNKPCKIGFSSLTEQNLPFYTGNVIYKAEIDIPECDNVNVKASSYRGGLVKVLVDGEEKGQVVYAPYTCDLGKIPAGKHTVEFKLYGNRFNAFGSLHNYNAAALWCGPGRWFTEDDEYGYEYQLKPLGILKSPIITFEKNKGEK